MLDRLTRMGRIGAPRRKFDVYLTEFSYQTSPPDHEVGISLGRQSRYLQQAAYLAWRLPRVRNLTQYQWRDEPVIVRGRGREVVLRLAVGAALRQRQAQAGACAASSSRS